MPLLISACVSGTTGEVADNTDIDRESETKSDSGRSTTF